MKIDLAPHNQAQVCANVFLSNWELSMELPDKIGHFLAYSLFLCLLSKTPFFRRISHCFTRRLREVHNKHHLINPEHLRKKYNN